MSFGPSSYLVCSGGPSESTEAGQPCPGPWIDLSTALNTVGAVDKSQVGLNISEASEYFGFSLTFTLTVYLTAFGVGSLLRMIR